MFIITMRTPTRGSIIDQYAYTMLIPAKVWCQKYFRVKKSLRVNPIATKRPIAPIGITSQSVLLTSKRKIGSQLALNDFTPRPRARSGWLLWCGLPPPDDAPANNPPQEPSKYNSAYWDQAPLSGAHDEYAP